MDLARIIVISVAALILIPIVLFILIRNPILLVLLLFLVIFGLVKFLEKKANG
jgi:hypothetical protein